MLPFTSDRIAVVGLISVLVSEVTDFLVLATCFEMIVIFFSLFELYFSGCADLRQEREGNLLFDTFMSMYPHGSSRFLCASNSSLKGVRPEIYVPVYKVCWLKARRKRKLGKYIIMASVKTETSLNV